MMLIGNKPLSMPAYTGALPAVMVVRCKCSLRYIVLTGVADAGAELVRREAEWRGAVFVDARVTPFLNCRCGQPLDFCVSLEASRVM
jgi:hypothetical protein